MSVTAFKQLADNAVSTTATTMSSTGVTSITVSTGDGSKFPAPGNGFLLTIWAGSDPTLDANQEKVTCTARSGDVLTVTATTKTHTGTVNVAIFSVSQNTVDLQTAINAIESGSNPVPGSGGGLTNPMTALGDTIYEDATPVAVKLSGNITTTKKYLSQTGNGTISAAPSWQQPAIADLSDTKTGTGNVVLATNPTLAGATITDATDIVLGTTTGTKIGTSTTQRVGFYGVAPASQSTNTTDLGTVLSNMGFRPTGTAYPISTSASVALTGSLRYGVNATSVAVTLTPGTSVPELFATGATAYSVTLGSTSTSGYRFTIKKVDASANAITIATAGGTGTIDGASTYALATQYKYVTVESTSTAGTWYIVGNN